MKTSLIRRISTDTHYVLTGFPAAVLAFCLVVTGVAAGAGSLVAFVGLPILAVTASLARAFADRERALLPGVLGRRLARPGYSQTPAGAGLLRRAVGPLAGGQSWMDLLHAIVAFPFAIAAFVITTVWWSGVIAGLTFPLYGWLIARIPGALDGGLPALLDLGHSTGMFILVNTVIGVMFALTLIPVVRGCALMKAGLAEALLTRPVEDTRSHAAVHAAGI
jgi:hypothetical protein